MKAASRQWLDIATEDLDTARAMLRGRRYLYACFEAQQAVKKALKAIIQESTRTPPRIHELERLGELACLDDEALASPLKALSVYYIAARYPEERDRIRAATDRAVAAGLVAAAEEVLAWARRKLTSMPS